MEKRPVDRLRREQSRLEREIERRELRRIRSRGEARTPWLGLRMFGMVGWSVAVPTLLGLFMGIYIDRRIGGAPGAGVSWTLTLLVLGVAAGCVNAWFWVAREGGLYGEGAHDGARRQDQGDNGDDHGQS